MTAINKTRTGQSPLLTKARANLKSGIAGKFSLNFESTEIFLLRIELLIQTYENENESLRAENYGLANCYCGAAKTKHEHTSDIAVNCQEISENNEEIKALKTLKTGIENLMRNTETTDEELANRIREMLGDDQENFVLSGSMDFFMNEDIWKDIISKDAKNISNFEYKVLAEVYLNLDDQGMEDFYNELFFYVKPDKSYGEDTSMKFYTSGEEIFKEVNGQFEPDRFKISKIEEAVNGLLSDKYAEIISLGNRDNIELLKDQYEDSIQREAALHAVSTLYDVKQNVDGRCVNVERTEYNEIKIHYIPNFNLSNPEYLEISSLISGNEWQYRFNDDLKFKLNQHFKPNNNGLYWDGASKAVDLLIDAGKLHPAAGVAIGLAENVADSIEEMQNIKFANELVSLNDRANIYDTLEFIGVTIECSVMINNLPAIEPILRHYPGNNTGENIAEINKILLYANKHYGTSYETFTLVDAMSEKPGLVDMFINAEKEKERIKLDANEMEEDEWTKLLNNI